MIENNAPQWKRLYIQSKVPSELESLEKLANNLWWSWNYDALNLFASIDQKKWSEVHHNPIALLDILDYEAYQNLLADESFLAKLKDVYERFEDYMKVAPKKSPSIAYFCMEYGLHASFKLYSGGLGVLAGDFLKEASDENINMIGIGLLYRYGYFNQKLSTHGEQVANYEPQRFTYLPIEPVRNAQGDWEKVQVQLPGRVLTAKIWKANVGRIALYLLDTDIEENSDEDKFITHQLYGGDQENRLKQEILLGIGGIRLLEALQHQPEVFHLNEGHAAFIGLERLRNYVKQGFSISEASELIRSSSLFTTHTPVPAGHDAFPEGMMWQYFNEFASAMSMSWEKFIALGRVNPDNKEEVFSMSNLASKLSQEVNGVSKIHGEVSREMFRSLYPGFEAEELHIDYVTNSVHYYSWTAEAWQKLYAKTFGKSLVKNQSDIKLWEKIKKVPDGDIMHIKRQQKRLLIDEVKLRLEKSMRARYESPKKIVTTLNAFDENTLIFGFARRFATYKRAALLFRNPERLAKIVNKAERPVQFIFAGKAHPADKGGQDLIRQIYDIAQRPDFIGKVIFLEDYDMDIAKIMVQGVDVWLNTPTRPLEASGTSGMKATMNGVINFSVLDGWWAEGYRPDAGWALPEHRTYDNQDIQNELDAETMYSMLENEIIPEYYEQDEEGVSQAWVARMKNAIAYIAPQFTMKRMMDDYHHKFYLKLAERNKLMNKDGQKAAKELSEWKGRIQGNWKNINVVERDIYNFANAPLPLGEDIKASIILDVGELKPEDISVEMLIARREDNELKIVASYEMQKQKVKPAVLAAESQGNFNGEGVLVRYTCNKQVTFSGVYEYGFRVYPTHSLLAHRQDFSLLSWI
ncbi:alpha-glucan family phosphorylase [Porifericola rhodea]|uniref:alpha-glucan family phosphorylase n=1 Tax=Porifericola rhodea TaxID=930972 RepID=UPI002664EA1F|nr:alpha-glucan family phosphorylase [Porifericola rhodea]WKN31638.1 alpha-glucan family phosphorylase [Porifericola rhodea]